MQLKIQRSQRQSGVVTKGVVFCINARVFFNAEEQANVQKYKLGSQILYTSEAAKRHADTAAARMIHAGAHNAAAVEYRSGEALARGLGHMAVGMFHGIAGRMALKITVNSLQNGQQVECKDLDEVLDAENALYDACKSLQGYLGTAATFDGREVVIDFSKDEPEVVSAPIALLPSTAPAPIVQSDAVEDIAPSSYSAAPGPYPATTAAPTYAQPQQNPFQPAIVWWHGLTKEQQKWIMIIGGVVVLFLLYEIF